MRLTTGTEELLLFAHSGGRPRDRRNPRFRTRPGGESEEERLAGEERKRAVYDYWGVVVRSVEVCGAVEVKSTRGKRRRREGRGLCGLRRRGWGWSADAIGTGCRGAGPLARSSLLLSVPPSLSSKDGRSQGRQAAAIRSNGKRDRSAETE